MEQELKYAIPDKSVADAIYSDEYIQSLRDNSTAESVVMKGIYFDTEDEVLSKNNVTFRVRLEGDRSFATVKWGGTHDGALAEREEVNVPVTDDRMFISPTADIFKESTEGLDLIALIDGKPLINMLETRYLRRRCRLNYKNSVMELAVDTGDIITDRGGREILEMELELYAGNIEDLLELGEKIAEKYELFPEEKSKFSRGLELIRG